MSDQGIDGYIEATIVVRYPAKLADYAESEAEPCNTLDDCAQADAASYAANIIDPQDVIEWGDSTVTFEAVV